MVYVGKPLKEKRTYVESEDFVEKFFANYEIPHGSQIFLRTEATLPGALENWGSKPTTTTPLPSMPICHRMTTDCTAHVRENGELSFWTLVMT